MADHDPRQGIETILGDEGRGNECEFCRHGFLAILSHELRNPLAALRNSLYVLRASDPSEPRAIRAIIVMERQLGRLASLVDDIGQAAAIGRGVIDLHVARSDLCELARTALADHEALFASRELELHEDIPRTPVYVLADPLRLSQVLGNLLQNAAQFTPRRGHVELTLQVDAQKSTARIQVRDSGIGLAPELRARLFQPFSQGDTSLARTAGGLGLGLALAKAFVDLHGGSISADSAGVGLGTTFTVVLPLPVASLRQAESSSW